MLRNILIVVAAIAACIFSTLAQSEPEQDPHKAYDQRHRECKRQATDNGLKGDDLNAFIAECMKQDIAPK
jgi:hypothetical protein